MSILSISDTSLIPTLSDDHLKQIASSFSKGDFKTITSNLLSNEILLKYSDHIYNQQILLSIYIFCLIKNKQFDIANGLFSTFEFPNNKTIFPLLFLKAKLISINHTTTNISLALVIYNEMLQRYEAYTNQDDKENIITIETFNSKFEIFKSFFVFLYSIDDVDAKIKKVLMEIKNLLYRADFLSESYEISKKMYETYPDDVIIQVEYAKDSLYVSNINNFKTMLNKIKEKQAELSKNEKLKRTYENCINYIEALELMARGEYKEANGKFHEIIKNDTTNCLIMNNIGVLHLYDNSPEESYLLLKAIANRNEMDCGNEVVQYNLNIVSDLFGFPKYEIEKK